MTPALYAVLGPLKGTTFELGEEELTIGRDRTNRVPIADLIYLAGIVPSRKNRMILFFPI